MSASVPSWAVPGVRVVCINDRRKHNFQPRIPVVVGAVYTIERVFTDPEVDEVYVDLVEAGAGWCITRFRPLVTRSQEHDVAQFRKLLIGAPKGVDA